MTKVERTGEARASQGGIANTGIQLILSFVLGDMREFPGHVRRWSGWNWPPFVLVVVLNAVALVIAPEGPAGQFVWVYMAMALAVVTSFWRVVGLRSARAGVRCALLTVCSLCSAVSGLVGMEHLAEHGEVDVTGPARVVPAEEVRDGGVVTVVVDNEPERARLRLTLDIEDAAPASQACTPDTTYTAHLAGNSGTSGTERQPGDPVTYPLGGIREEVRIDVTVHTDQGCRMSVAIAEAALYD